MSPRFGHYLKVVTIAHVLVLAGLLVVSGWRRWVRPKPTVTLPVDFVVQAPRTETAQDPSPPVPSTPTPPPPPVSEPPPSPPPPAPQPKPRKPIVRSAKRVTRSVDPPVSEPRRLSKEDIRKLLERGARLGDHTHVAEGDRVLLDRIRRALYEAWSQPSKEEAGEAVARAEVTLGLDGRITGRRLIGSSGNSAMDASVLQALRSVTRIEGVTPAFLKRHPSVKIAFKVE